ncbi:hypothetical protein DTL21_19870 [Bremerella cremea]|uniref:Uncharacterized protein n=1 Tax=Blastopirellula marina TaxID=124 RepID=A0A2S8FJY7_9BACT|nr:hypothetical protein C5Y83_19850 [Blastopirellula marina]RCS45540.1 hypothetical protein DTL21_19870 [Bremerella cremea]
MAVRVSLFLALTIDMTDVALCGLRGGNELLASIILRFWGNVLFVEDLPEERNGLSGLVQDANRHQGQQSGKENSYEHRATSTSSDAVDG